MGAAGLSAMIVHRIGSSKAACGGQLRSSALAWFRDAMPCLLCISQLSLLTCSTIGLRAQRERNQRLRGRLDILLNENEELHAKVSDLKVKLDVARLCNAIMVQVLNQQSFQVLARGSLCLGVNCHTGLQRAGRLVGMRQSKPLQLIVGDDETQSKAQGPRSAIRAQHGKGAGRSHSSGSIRGDGGGISGVRRASGHYEGSRQVSVGGGSKAASGA